MRLDISIPRIWVFFLFLKYFLSIPDGYMKFVLEDIHYVKCCKKIVFFVCFPPRSLCTDLIKKNAEKWPLFKKRWEVFADFRPIFSNNFFLWSKCNIFIPQKVWLLYLSYLVIILILNDRHNQQKFQIFQKFKNIWNFCWLWRSFKIKNITKYESCNQTFWEMNILHLLHNKKLFEKIGWKLAKTSHCFEKWSFLGIFWFKPVHKGLRWETDKNKIFFTTLHIMYVLQNKFHVPI